MDREQAHGNVPNPKRFTLTVLGVERFQNPVLQDLDNDDAYAFRDFLEKKGWLVIREHYNESVKPEHFTEAGSDSDILFYTGHGSKEGRIPLYPRGSFINEDVGWKGVWKRNKFTFLMVCSLLEKTDWGFNLEDGAHHLFGYWGSTSEKFDSQVVQRFLRTAYGEYDSSMPARTVKDAYEYANTAWEQPWAIIGHLANEKDYMFGVKEGLTPDQTGIEDIFIWHGRQAFLNLRRPAGEMAAYPARMAEIKVSPEGLDVEGVAKGLLGLHPLSKPAPEQGGRLYTNRISALYAYSSGAIIYEGERRRQLVGFDRMKAVQLAAGFIKQHGGLPEDAVVEKVVQLTEQSLIADGARVTGYMIVYRHRMGGHQVAGQAGDAIKVIVDAGGIPYYYRMWRRYEGTVPDSSRSIIEPEQAVEEAFKHFPVRFKTTDQPVFEAAELVYWSLPFVSLQETMVPAWKVTMSGGDIYIDGYKGQYLDEAKYM